MTSHRLAPARPSTTIVALVALLALAAAASAQLTTNDWVPTGNGFWTNGPNWTLDPDVPDTNTDVAQFTNVYGANFTVTLDANLTINGIIYDDTDAVGNDAILILARPGSEVLTFDGTDPFVESRSSTSGGDGIRFNLPVDVGAAGLTKIGFGVANLASNLSGSGTVTVSQGALEVRGDNVGFTGEFVVNGGVLDIRTGVNNSLGTNAAGTTINGTGQLRFRDMSNRTFTESVTVNGFNNQGSIKSYASSNITFAGPVTLNTNGVIALEQWFSTREPGRKQDFFFNSAVSDDGNSRGIHYLHGVGTGANGTGTASRTSEFVVGGASTYGGYTHITANRAADGAGPFTSTVRLTNGNDRLPTTTTVILGGVLNNVGHAEGNGWLVLNGYNQELAGLTTLGTGISNRVTGGQATPSTLTLNIGAGNTNTFAGFLGGPDANDNNLALVSRGPGVLNLAGANTYTGATSVTNGTLLVNGTHLGGGAYSIQNGGTGLIEAALQTLAGSVVAPGNSIGTLTLNGDAEIDGALKIELDGTGLGFSDVLVVTGALDISQATLDFDVLTALDDNAYIFATYGSLVGTEFASIQDLPSGYDVVYGYGGNNIALVIPEPSTFALFALGLAIVARLAGNRRRRTIHGETHGGSESA